MTQDLGSKPADETVEGRLDTMNATRETLEDYTLRFAPRSYRKWSTRVVGISALGGIAYLADFAIGANIGFAVQAYPEKPLRDFRFDRLDLDVKEAGAIANAVDWRFTEARLTGLDGSPPVLTDSSRIVGLSSAT